MGRLAVENLSQRTSAKAQQYIVIERTGGRRVTNVFYWYKVLKSKPNRVLNNGREHRDEMSRQLAGFIELSVDKRANGIERWLRIWAFGNQGNGFTHTRFQHE